MKCGDNYILKDPGADSGSKRKFRWAKKINNNNSKKPCLNFLLTPGHYLPLGLRGWDNHGYNRDGNLILTALAIGRVPLINAIKSLAFVVAQVVLTLAWASGRVLISNPAISWHQGIPSLMFLIVQEICDLTFSCPYEQEERGPVNVGPWAKNKFSLLYICIYWIIYVNKKQLL